MKPINVLHNKHNSAFVFPKCNFIVIFSHDLVNVGEAVSRLESQATGMNTAKWVVIDQSEGYVPKDYLIWKELVTEPGIKPPC